LPRRLEALGNVRLVAVDQAVEAADIVALLVDHDRFRVIKKTRLEGKVVYDTRGLWA
jgi:UDP-N-acetyl-D-mannosaminuronic acid dehydrogenase